MTDLYLEAMLHKNDEHEDESELDLIIDKLTDEYIDANSLLSDATKNSLIPIHLQRAKLKSEIKNEAKMPELSAYLKNAYSILLGSENQEVKEQLLEMNKYLAEIDFTKLPEQNFAVLLHLTPSTLDAIFTMAQDCYSKNKWDDCLSIFAFLTTLDPENFDYWYRLGLVANKCGKYNLALNAFTNASSLNSNFVGSRIFSTDLYLKLNQKNNAKIEFCEAKSLMEKEAPEPIWKDMIDQIESSLKVA